MTYGFVRSPVESSEKMTKSHFPFRILKDSLLIDNAAGFASMVNRRKPQLVVTNNLHVNYFRPASEGELIAVGKVIKQGKNIDVCEVSVYPLESYVPYMAYEDLQGTPIESSGKMTKNHFSNRILTDNNNIEIARGNGTFFCYWRHNGKTIRKIDIICIDF